MLYFYGEMRLWEVEFYPAEGKAHSPADSLEQIEDDAEKSKILHRLGHMEKEKISEWPANWLNHLEDKLWELYGTNYRAIYCLDEGTIVVLHVCKKVSRKTRKRDLERARIHFNEYFS